MSFRVTRKAIMQEYGTVIRIPYAEFQYILDPIISPIAHTEGIYGWNADIYDMEAVNYAGVAICSGYRPFGTSVAYETERAAVRKMERIRKDYLEKTCNYEFYKTSLLMILKDFVREATEEIRRKKER